MKTIYWIIIGGIALIGLYLSGTLSKIIPNIASPSSRVMLPHQQVTPFHNVHQVTYNQPMACFKGICTPITPFPDVGNV
jgi:hypothetical protein